AAADRLRHSAVVGATHWERLAGASDLPGPAPEFFFAPTHIERLTAELGPGGLQRRLGEAWAEFLGQLGDWMEIEHGEGPEAVEPARLAEPGSPAFRSIELACRRLAGADVEWLRSRKPAARRDGVQCWHASPRNPVWEFVGSSNAGACLSVQRAELGLIGHTHAPGAWQQTPGGAARRVRVTPDVPLDISTGKWLLNPGAVGAPEPPRLGWWDALDAQAADGAFWLLLDLARHTATWQRAPYDPGPARAR